MPAFGPQFANARVSFDGEYWGEAERRPTPTGKDDPKPPFCFGSVVERKLQFSADGNTWKHLLAIPPLTHECRGWKTFFSVILVSAGQSSEQRRMSCGRLRCQFHCNAYS